MTPKTLETDRGIREPLTRARILNTALTLIDRDGLDEFSMRKLAVELDVSAMSLYNHVPNKEAVLEGVTEALLAEIDVSSLAESDDWVEGLKAGLRSFRRVLLEHPNALTLIETKSIVTPDAMRPIELSLATLRRAGFSSDDAVRAHWTLVGYTIGHVGFQVNSPIADPSRVEEMALRRQQLPVEQFPNLFECLRVAMEGDFDAAFEFGMDALFAGLRAKLGAN